MNFGGWQKISLVDYPDKIATVVFTNGCIFRCHFCYNSNLIKAPFPTNISSDEIYEYLKLRQGKIDAIVITGGEPTMHSDLAEFINKAKQLGYLIKLDTNGYLPDKFEKVLQETSIDYIAMDIKAPLNKYSDIVGITVDQEKIQKSIKLIIDSGINHEFRTTIIDEDHDIDDVTAMAKLISGSQAYYLQPFQPTDTLIDPAYKKKTPPSLAKLQQMKIAAEQYVPQCIIRSY